MNKDLLILIDADVLIHLYKAERISLLTELFPGRLRMLDIVLNELRNNRSISNALDAIFLFSKIEEIVLPITTNQALYMEYIQLKNIIRGAGERATLLYCKYYKHIIASSNTKDIVPFSAKHSIGFITTLDIFAIAIHRGLVTNKEANEYISLITHNDGSYLCCATIESHVKHHFDPSKKLY